jgi:hypothetical protein
MNLWPLAKFYMRRETELGELLGDAANPARAAFISDCAADLVALAKKWRPALNKTGLLDDALATLREMLGVVPAQAHTETQKNDAQA